jgi:hypothetical protein
MLQQLHFNKSLGITLNFVGNEMSSAVTMNAERIFRRALGDSPVFVYPLVLSEASLGNNLGRLFQATAVVRELGFHFIALPQGALWQNKVTSSSRPVSHPHKENMGDVLYAAFAESLVMTIEHETPSLRSSEDITAYFQNFDSSFPWEKAEQPWVRQADLIGAIMKSSLDSVAKQAYHRSVHKLHLPPSVFRDTRGNLSSSLGYNEWPEGLQAHRSNYDDNRSGDDNYRKRGNVSENVVLPFIPDVVIKIRCNDVIQFPNGDKYGLHYFYTYLAAIPPSARSIYVLAEPQDRNRLQKQMRRQRVFDSASVCDGVLTALIDDLAQWFPTAFVGLIRGGNLIDSMLQIANAHTVISSASTLSLWAMLANDCPQGRLIFPTTTLITEGKQQFLTDNFFWVSHPKQLGFGGVNYGDRGALSKILSRLRGVPRRDATPTKQVRAEEPNDSKNTPTGTQTGMKNITSSPPSTAEKKPQKKSFSVSKVEDVDRSVNRFRKRGVH